jgi:hypothetical protein
LTRILTDFYYPLYTRLGEVFNEAGLPGGDIDGDGEPTVLDIDHIIA